MRLSKMPIDQTNIHHLIHNIIDAIVRTNGACIFSITTVTM